MAYDLVAEAQRVLAGGTGPARSAVLADPPPRLSRRRRLVAMAADVDADAAAVLFARRGVSGQPCFELLLFEYHRERDAAPGTADGADTAGGGWWLVGGSGGQAEDDVLDDRPPAFALGGPLRWEGGGSCRSALAPRIGLRRQRWLYHAQVRAAAETHEVQVRGSRGERMLPVWRHGQLVVIWRGGGAPELTALGDDGRPLGETSSLAAGGW
jgi:hypothetical protein